MSITVVVPAFNEASNIGAVLDRIGTVFDKARLDYTILVVDDGSTDGTDTVVAQFQDQFPIKILRHPKNLGLGRALSTGLVAAAAMGEVVATMDADNSHDPAYILQMLREIKKGNDIVIASRFRRGSECFGVPLYRQMLSIGAAGLLKTFFPMRNVRDYSTGFRVYRSRSLRDLISSYGNDFIHERGFACSIELLLKLRKLGAKAQEVPYTLRYDLKQGASKMKVFRTVARYFVVMHSVLRNTPSRLPDARELPRSEVVIPRSAINA